MFVMHAISRGGARASIFLTTVTVCVRAMSSEQEAPYIREKHVCTSFKHCFEKRLSANRGSKHLPKLCFRSHKLDQARLRSWANLFYEHNFATVCVVFFVAAGGVSPMRGGVQLKVTSINVSSLTTIPALDKPHIKNRPVWMHLWLYSKIKFRACWNNEHHISSQANSARQLNRRLWLQAMQMIVSLGRVPILFSPMLF